MAKAAQPYKPAPAKPFVPKAEASAQKETLIQPKAPEPVPVKAEPVQQPTQPSTIKVTNVYSYPMFYVNNGEEVRIQGPKTVERTRWIEDQIKAGLLKEIK